MLEVLNQSSESCMSRKIVHNAPICLVAGLATLLLDDIGQLLDLALGAEKCAELRNIVSGGHNTYSAATTVEAFDGDTIDDS